jgi:hypothetical protein
MGGKARVGLASGIARALQQLVPILDAHRGHNVVIGGIAVIARGVPRVTRDIDIAFSGAEVDVGQLISDLRRAGIAPRIEDPLAFAAQSQMLLVRHVESGVEIDISLAWLPFELEAMAAAGPAKVGDTTLQVAQPEDLIIYKAIAWRPQDQQDVERLFALHGARMDLSRIRRHVRELGEAMEQDRSGALEVVIRRVLGG